MNHLIPPDRPLSGIRILDLGWVYSIPHCTAWLGTLGAEVLRVETTDRPDIVRGVPATAITDGIGGINRAPGFLGINYSKQGITLNLGTPEGLQLARELVMVSDVVTENFASGVIDRLGLGYETLREIKPDIVMLTGTLLGSTGPEPNATGWGPNACAYAGLPFISGYEGGPPADLGGTWPDYAIGTAMVFSLLSAVYHQRRTGQGQKVEMAMADAVAAMIPEAVLEYTINGRERPRMGNRDEIMAPHGVYPCRGAGGQGSGAGDEGAAIPHSSDDAWVAIAVGTDAEWRALCHAIGDASCADDPRFRDALSRQCNQDELDQLVAGWTCRYTPDQAMHTLQAAGVAAGAVRDVPGVVADPHLVERGFMVEVDHPEVGRRAVPGLPVHFGAIPQPLYTGAPTLGQHNRDVFCNLLHLSEKEFSRLVDDKVIY
jgi:benzylsuccinate CoA-transferase BbsF subunit